MSESARRIANDEQRAASDPFVSAFVGASAGSGKTTLLVNRLLRLMLAGVPPGRILCLTYTRAAAAEMAIRLRRVLGDWVAMPDDKLDKVLRDLGEGSTDEMRGKARRLFATVLDLPGGMRIETIHAFCQSLLRRFPLEAALPPHFRLIEEADAGAALAEAREAVLGQAERARLDDALRLLAGEVSANDFASLVRTLGKRPADAIAAASLPPDDLAARLRAALSVRAAGEAGLMQQAVCWPEEAALLEAVRAIAANGPPSMQTKAATLLDWLVSDYPARIAAWVEWHRCFIRKQGGAYSARYLTGEKLAARRPDLLAAMVAEAERIEGIEDQRRGLGVAAICAALLRLAAPMLADYGGRKLRAGMLDYDDLIARSENLLANPGAAWVLYKLDGGIDHVLLDEVQDTAPAQWRIANALTGEFFSGAGAREEGAGPPRSVFAVGDRKQSIYSFQGADADAFDTERALLAARVKAGGARWLDGRLDVSFRSTVPVLALVDAVFAQPEAAHGVVEREAGGAPAPLRHIAAREGMAGAVELWPLAPQPERPDDDDASEDGVAMSARRGQPSASQTLAETLAGWIALQTRGDVSLESQGRPLAPGDMMVLVRRRSTFTAALLKALKARGVPVGGLDRLVLTAQPAVQDLMALGAALLLPEDDLTFAEYLTSPLGGLTDDAMMALAVERGGAHLWEALRARAGERADWRAAWDFFAALQRRVDHATPHALFAEALGRLGGRARLFARLGPEAAEPVDEMLNAALAYQQGHPPSLQGFLHWLAQSGAEVKREQEAAGGAVRIMTVHGAKGQEAPLVILPDTTGLPPVDRLAVDWTADKLPLWAPRSGQRNRAVQALRDAARQREIAEYNRLLYVALTRAQDRLLVCGYAPKKATPANCWYSLVESGFRALPGVQAAPFPNWPGEALRYAVPQTAPLKERPAQASAQSPAALPAWAGNAPAWRPAPPPPEPPLPAPLAPSRPENAALGAVPAADSPLSQRDPAGRRFLRGQLIHGLLQHLPALPEAAREAAALSWLERPGHTLPLGAARAIRDEVMAILNHPELAPLFGRGSRAEVPLTGVVAGRDGPVVVGGLVDRLAVLPDSVLVADFKTNRDPPADPAATPVLYLRQLAAYRAVLRGVFPGLPVRCALVWTQVARVAMLPDHLLDPHDPAARAAPVDPQAA